MVGETTSTEPQPQEDEPPGESPQLTFRRYAIAFHLAATRIGKGDPGDRGKTREERAMASYEDDMLLYAHRDDPPFSTRIVPAELKSVTVHLPPTLAYESEGEAKHVVCAGATEAGRTRDFGIAIAETVFKPGELAVLSLVLTPTNPPSDDSELNEYDVIKLVKLWEGGEGRDGAPSAIAEGDDPDIWFSSTLAERATLHQLASLAFPEWQPLGSKALPGRRSAPPERLRRFFRRPRPDPDVVTTARSGYRVGTVELELPPNDWTHELFHDIATLKERGEAPRSDPDSKRWERAVAVGGILQGLLDFGEIADYELADVFAEVDIDPEDETMRAFHKGTLLSLSVEDEDDPDDNEREPPLGVDSYLAVPNIVLLYSEQRLKSARLREADLSDHQRVRFRDRVAIGETENGLSEMAGILAQHLPNVFHYPSERRLQKRGHESRGLNDLETYIRLRMDDLSSVLQSRVRRRDRWTAAVGIAVGVVTAFLVQQAIEGRPTWLIFAGAVALFVVFLWLRDKLF